MKEQFDYDESVKKTRAITKQWKRLGVEMFRELSLAKEFLYSKKERQKKPSLWSGYCAEIGISRQTADFWLRKLSLYTLPKNSEHKTVKRRKA